MLDALMIRKHQGWQYIPNPLQAKPTTPFRGWPHISSLSKTCAQAECACVSTCPTNALSKSEDGLRIDLGACTFCGDCQKACSKGSCITFTNEPKLAADARHKLIISAESRHEDYIKTSIELRKEITRIFGRSLKLRQVSAGGCNACEWELNACSNVNFDMGRYGIEFVASPRHADGIVITGPITQNMAYALEDTFYHVPEPRLLILAGTCAISGGVFQNSPALNRTFLEKHTPHLYIPGCPVHPLTVIDALFRFIHGYSHKYYHS